jgi:hypothetical protein
MYLGSNRRFGQAQILAPDFGCNQVPRIARRNMRTRRISTMTTRLVIFALSAVTFAIAPQALKAAQEAAFCPLGNETLHGNYISRGMGTRVGVGPITATGWATFDGKGNFVHPGTASINGVIDTSTEIGTYTVNSDCTGSEVATDGSQYYIVVAPDGSRYTWISTVPGRVVSGTAIRFPRRRGDD